ncbi:MAG: metalloregulator ArsR/SmtB family transcription factor [Bacteroidota bacterium]|nr:metalloregulator ArsR/SmtB family transcription factor [Bacteroidota bacterium]
MIQEINAAQFENAATMLKAISHPMRIAILSLLENNEKLTVTEIHESLNLEQSTTSHHLGILKDKMVLSSERKGKNTFYYLKNKNLLHIVDCIKSCTDC